MSIQLTHPFFVIPTISNCNNKLTRGLLIMGPQNNLNGAHQNDILFNLAKLISAHPNINGTK